MSWTDAESPWRRTQARRVRMQFVSLLVIGLITVVLIAGLVSIVRPMLLDLADSGPRSGRSFRTLTLLALAIPVAVFLLSGVMIIRRFRIERQILHRIPELNGAMCPKCRRPLTDETDDASCPRCGRVGSAAEVRSFWEAYPSEASMSHLRRRHPVAVRGKTSLPGSGVPRFIQAIQRRPAYIVLLLAGIWILAGFMMSWFTGGSVLVNMMGVSWGIMAPFAFFIFFLGGAHRVGDSVHCAKCDYEQTRGETGERCPECANLWLEPGGVVHGHVIRRPALKWAGAAVFVAVFALMLFPMFFRGRTNALKPTWLLIDEVVGTWGFTMDQWAELGGRTLTRDHELELMRGLLDKRIERGWLSDDANRWLGAMLQAGKVSADLTERYYREMLRAEFAEAGPAVVGQPITLTLDIAGSRPLWVKQELLMVVDGTYVDDASTPMGRATTPLDIWDLPEAGFRRYRFATAEIVPRQPGPMRVRFVFWHLYATPQNAAPPIVWSADNRPVLPPTVIWSRKVELETVVEGSAR